MATKVYDSPTTNIFALLAEEHAAEPQTKKTKANASKGPETELTPKERAEAKAVQDAARKAQREVEKAKQEAEAARRKALELIDDTGFAPQRHQRIKESRLQERNAPEVPKSPKSPKSKSKEGWGDETGSDKGKGKGDWNKGPKGEGNKGSKTSDTPKGDWGKDKAGKGPVAKGTPSGEKSFAKGEKTFNKEGKGTFNKGEGKGNFNKGEGKGNFNKGEGKGNFKQGPKSYDKHSQGVTSRQFHPKKAGAGKANWDETVPAGLNAAPVQDALASEALAAPATGEVDGWGDTPSTPAADDASAPADADAAPADKDAVEKKKDDDSEDENQKTLEEYMAEQAEKRKALDALVGSAPQARQLTDEEKKSFDEVHSRRKLQSSKEARNEDYFLKDCSSDCPTRWSSQGREASRGISAVLPCCWCSRRRTRPRCPKL